MFVSYIVFFRCACVWGPWAFTSQLRAPCRKHAHPGSAPSAHLYLRRGVSGVWGMAAIGYAGCLIFPPLDAIIHNVSRVWINPSTASLHPSPLRGRARLALHAVLLDRMLLLVLPPLIPHGEPYL